MAREGDFHTCKATIPGRKLDLGRVRYGSIRVGWPMPEKGPLYAHLRKDEKWAAAAALGQMPKKLMVSITGPLASLDGTY